MNEKLDPPKPTPPESIEYQLSKLVADLDKLIQEKMELQKELDKFITNK